MSSEDGKKSEEVRPRLLFVMSSKEDIENKTEDILPVEEDEEEEGQIPADKSDEDLPEISAPVELTDEVVPEEGEEDHNEVAAAVLTVEEEEGLEEDACGLCDDNYSDTEGYAEGEKFDAVSISSLSSTPIPTPTDPGLLQRTVEFDAMLEFIESGDKDFQKHKKMFFSHVPAESYEETWDYTLKPQRPDNKDGRRTTIWLTDVEFLQRLEEYNVFETCTHEVVKIPCPCSNKTLYSICAKCHRVFCSSKCLKLAKEENSCEPTPQAKENATADPTNSDVNVKNKTGDIKEQSSKPETPKSIVTNGVIENRSETSRSERPTRPQRKQRQSSSSASSSITVVNVNQSRGVGYRHNENFAHENQNRNPFMNSPHIFSHGPPGHFPRFEQQPPFYDDFPPMYTLPPMMSSPYNLPFPPPGYPLPPVERNSIGFRGRGLQRGHFIPTTHDILKFNSSTRNPRNSIPMENLESYGNPPASLMRINLSSRSQAESLASGRNRQAKRGGGKSNSRIGADATSPRNLEDQEYDLTGPGPNNSTNRSFNYEYPHSPPVATNSYKSFPSNFNKKRSGNNKVSPPYEAESRRILRRPEVDYPRSPSFTQTSPSKSRANDQEFRRSNDQDFSSAGSKHHEHFGAGKKTTGPVFPESTPHFASNTNQNQRFTIRSKESSPSTSTAIGDASSHIHRHRISGMSEPPELQVTRPRLKQNIRTEFCDPSPVVDYTKNNLIEQESVLLYGLPTMVGYSFGDSFFDFFVWNGYGRQNIDYISAFLQQQTRDVLPLASPITGEHCLAKYFNSDDEEEGWYRAKILSVNEHEVAVYFIDYGNVEEMSIKDIGQLPVELRCKEPSAIRLSIGDFKPTALIDKLEDAFKSFIVDQWVRATIIDKIDHNEEETKTMVDVKRYRAKIETFYEGKWFGLADILQNENLGEKVPLEETTLTPHFECDDEDFPMNEDIQISISHVNDPNDFYVVPQSRWEERDRMMKMLNSNVNLFDKFDRHIWKDTNYVCVARRKDGRWARGKIDELTDTFNTQIRFIDFGDVEEISNCDELRSIPTEFVATKQFAYRCSLPVFPISKNGWNLKDPDITILNELKNSEEPIFIIVFGLEVELGVHIAEVYIKQSTSGLSKSLLKTKKDDCVNEYDKIDLNIRKQLQQNRKKGDNGVSANTKREDPKTELIPQVAERHSETPKPHFDARVHLQPMPRRSIPMIRDIEPQKPLNVLKFSYLRIQSFDSMNKLSVKPVELSDIEMQIQDEVIELIDSGDGTAPDSLVPGAVVIALYSDGNHHRAVVKSVTHKHAKVEFLDVGRFQKEYAKDQLQLVSDTLLKFQKLNYEVRLKGVDDDPPRLLQEDYMEFMGNIESKLIKIETCSGDCEPYLVDLRLKNARVGDTISRSLLKKQIWEWENLLSNNENFDTDIIAKSIAGVGTESKIRPQKLDVGAVLHGTVTRIDREFICVNQLRKVTEDYLARNERVLQNQIAHYTTKVNEKPYCPQIGEVAFVYLENIELLKRLGFLGLGKWHRCLKLTQCYRNIDTGEIYPSHRADIDKHLKVRRMPAQFLRVPMGFISCVVEGWDQSPSRSPQDVICKIENEFKKGTPIRFTIKKCIDDAYTIKIDGFSV